MKYLPLLLILSTITFGCSAKGPIFKGENFNDKTTVRLYIYRPEYIVNRIHSADVYIDNLCKGHLSNNGHMVFELKPGEHKVSMDGPGMINSETMVILNPGQDHYLRYRMGYALFMFIPLDPGSLKVVDPSSASHEIAKTKLSY